MKAISEGIDLYCFHMYIVKVPVIQVKTLKLIIGNRDYNCIGFTSASTSMKMVV